jgi:hypothetical protein
MEAEDFYYGIVFVDRRCLLREVLRGKAGIISFLKAHLFDIGEVRIVGPHAERMVFRAIDGVDLHSELRNHGIDLRQIYEEVKQEALALIQSGEAREPWESDYDSLGVSPTEIAMRQRVKGAAKAARTVADVASLLEGTYFDALFETEDGERAWSSFDPATMSASCLAREDLPWEGATEHAWRNSSETVTLSPTARVRHRGSGEDVHVYVILDPPE